MDTSSLSVSNVCHSKKQWSPFLGQALPRLCPREWFYLSMACNQHPPLLSCISCLYHTPIESHCRFSNGRYVYGPLPYLKARELGTKRFEVTCSCSMARVSRAVEPGYGPGSLAFVPERLVAWSAWVPSASQLAIPPHPPIQHSSISLTGHSAVDMVT